MPEQPTLPAGVDRRCIADLIVGERVRSVFLLSRCDLRTTQKGDSYLALELSDRSGSIGGRLWEDAEATARRVSVGDFVQVEGAVDTWQSTPQVRVESLTPADPTALDPADFLPSSERDPDEMYRQLLAIIDGFENEHLRHLLEDVFEDADVAHRIRRAPAGVRLHHAYVGGLLEHTLSVTGLAEGIARHYPRLDRDLLLAGAMLHDLGKIWELSYETSFDYTESGRLVGHLVMETTWLARRIDRIEGFPENLRNHLLHLLVSHHGVHEHGAPVLPATPEALVLHYADDLDSKMSAMRAAIAEARASDNITAYSRSLGRRVLGRSWDDEES